MPISALPSDSQRRFTAAAASTLHDKAAQKERVHSALLSLSLGFFLGGKERVQSTLSPSLFTLWTLVNYRIQNWTVLRLSGHFCLLIPAAIAKADLFYDLIEAISVISRSKQQQHALSALLFCLFSCQVLSSMCGGWPLIELQCVLSIEEWFDGRWRKSVGAGDCLTTVSPLTTTTTTKWSDLRCDLLSQLSCHKPVLLSLSVEVTIAFHLFLLLFSSRSQSPNSHW